MAHSIAGALGTSQDVVTARSSADALARLVQREHCDVLVCAPMMPEATGMELRERAAGLDPTIAAHFVFVTGGAFTDRARDFLARTPNACMEKPFEPARLRAAVDRTAEPGNA